MCALYAKAVKCTNLLWNSLCHWVHWWQWYRSVGQQQLKKVRVKQTTLPRIHYIILHPGIHSLYHYGNVYCHSNGSSTGLCTTTFPSKWESVYLLLRPRIAFAIIYNHFKGRKILPEFLSLRFLNTEMITSRFPSTSTTVVKIKTLARIAMTQAGRALPSVASVRSSCPSRDSVRFFMCVNVSGITGPQTNAVFKSQLCLTSRRYRKYRCVLN